MEYYLSVAVGLLSVDKTVSNTGHVTCMHVRQHQFSRVLLNTALLRVTMRKCPLSLVKCPFNNAREMKMKLTVVPYILKVAGHCCPNYLFRFCLDKANYD